MNGCYNIRNTAKKIVEILAEDEIPIKWMDDVFAKVRDIAGSSIINIPHNDKVQSAHPYPETCRADTAVPNDE